MELRYALSVIEFEMKSMSSKNADGLIFRGLYSYRKPQVAIMATLCILWFGPIFYLFFRDLFRPHTRSEIALGIGLCIFTGFFLFVGLKFVYYYFTDHKMELTIDLTGVTYGRRFYPWSSIATVT